MNTDYFFNTRDYHEDLAKQGKKFYRDFAKYLSRNIQEADDLKKILDAKKNTARLIYEFWYDEYIKNPGNAILRIKYIDSLIEYRRYLIMFDIVFGIQPSKLQKLTGDDLAIVKSIAKGELDDVIEGKSRLPHYVPQPSNTNRPPKK
jgi:hypothetical protein